MIGEAGHRDALRGSRFAVVSMCKRDAENLRSNHCVVGICLVEVAATEQQERLRMLRLEVVELFHHRSQRFLCHVPYSFILRLLIVNDDS